MGYNLGQSTDEHDSTSRFHDGSAEREGCADTDHALLRHEMMARTTSRPVTQQEYQAWVAERAVLDKFVEQLRGASDDELRALGRKLLAVVGLAGEAAEVLDEFKKQLFHGRPEDARRISKELGDTNWYYNLALEAFGLTAQGVQDQNVEKLIERDGVNQERWDESRVNPETKR